MKLASLVTSDFCTKTQTQEIWDQLIPAYCYEFKRSHEIWNAYRADIKRKEPDSVKKIFETFRQQLKYPSRKLNKICNQFQRFCAEFANDLPDFDMNLHRTELQEMMEKSQAFEFFERQIEQVEETMTKVLIEDNQSLKEDIKQVCRISLLTMAIGYFRNFIAKCIENQLLPQEEILIIYERMIIAFPLQVEPCHEYLYYLFRLIETDTNSLHAFSEITMNVIARGMRRSPEVQQEVQALILQSLIDFTMTPEIDFRGILEHSKAQACASSKDLVANIFIAHLTHLKQILNEESFQNKFIVSVSWLFLLFGKHEEPDGRVCDEYLKVMARLSGEKILKAESLNFFNEQLIAEFPLHVPPWKCYLDFLFKMIAHDKTSQIYCTIVDDVISRGMQQNIEPIQRAIGTSILNALQYCNQTKLDEIQEILHNVGTFTNSEDHVANIILAYLNHLSNVTDKIFDLSWQFFGAIFNKSEKDVNDRKTKNTILGKRQIPHDEDEMSSSKKFKQNPKITILQGKRQVPHDDDEMSFSKKFKQNCGI